MLQSKGWFLENWQFVVIGAAIVVLAVVGIVYYSGSRTAKVEEAKTQFAQAMSSYRNQATQPAILDLTRIVEDYGNTPQASRACFLLGDLHYRNRNYEEAVRYFEMCLDRYKKDGMMRAAALGGIAACLEEQSQFAAAGDKFREAYDELPDGPLADDHLASAVRCYLEADDMAQAEAALDIIEDRFADSERGRNAIRLYQEHTVG
jgi:TolA-binding protein